MSGEREHRCEPGRTTVDPACTWHPQHYWCSRCEGFYGVPHGSDGCHSPNGKQSMGGSPHPDCACRYCVNRYRSGPSAGSTEGEQR